MDLMRSKIEVPRDVRYSTSGNITSLERLLSTLEHMRIPNGTGPGVRGVNRKDDLGRS